MGSANSNFQNIIKFKDKLQEENPFKALDITWTIANAIKVA